MMKTVTGKKHIGIVYIIGAALCFALMNLFVRLSGDLPVMQKVFFRNLVAAVVAVILLIREGRGVRIQKGSLPFHFLRSGLGFLGVILNFYAIDHLNISDASILNKLSPFFAVIFSVFLLKEKPSWLESLLLCVAFVGAIFVINPTFSWEVLPALCGFASGICAGFAYTCIRILGKKGERSNMTIFFFSVFSTVASLPFLLISFQPMTFLQVVFLLLAGASAAGGQLCITSAYRHAPAKEIGVFDYTQVLFAALLGFFFLDQIPEWNSFVGYVVIIGAAIATWLGQRHRAKQDSEKKEAVKQEKTEGNPSSSQ